jgi:hypothetical protein
MGHLGFRALIRPVGHDIAYSPVGQDEDPVCHVPEFPQIGCDPNYSVARAGERTDARPNFGP